MVHLIYFSKTLFSSFINVSRIMQILIIFPIKVGIKKICRKKIFFKVATLVRVGKRAQNSKYRKFTRNAIYVYVYMYVLYVNKARRDW